MQENNRMSKEELQRESRIGENPPYGLVCEAKPRPRTRRGFISVWVVCQARKSLMTSFSRSSSSFFLSDC
jgi:hypothetical protein